MGGIEEVTKRELLLAEQRDGSIEVGSQLFSEASHSGAVDLRTWARSAASVLEVNRVGRPYFFNTLKLLLFTGLFAEESSVTGIVIEEYIQ